jgi:hypothetical protein
MADPSPPPQAVAEALGAFARHTETCRLCAPEPSHSLACEDGRLLHLALIEAQRAAGMAPPAGEDFGEAPADLPHETVEGDPDEWPGDRSGSA